ncbi:MAG: DALR anticodon-binding domain-containing protein, partial [Rhodospirillaceae bacterium]
EDWEPRPQTLFRATQFGDDVDRPLKKADGAFTYFANDIGYHHDKFRRGFNKMIDIFGADHGGYVKRMTAAVKAASDGAATLDVRLCQLVNLTENGEKLKMSKRAGTFVTLREVVERVGKDVVRFMMLTRKNDAPLDFDFAKVTEQTRDNPVFYVQYAHARCCSVLRHAAATDSLAGQDLSADGLSGLESLADLTKAPEDVEMIRILAQWPRVIEAAAEAREPHRLAYYLGDVAAGFHSLWNKGNEATELRFLLPDDPETTLVRLALVQGVKTVIASGLDVMGVTPMEEMH